jgi:hypothetical protein
MARAVKTLLLLAFLLLFAAVAWVAVRGAQARNHIEDAADGVTRLEREMSRLEIGDARATVREIQRDTDRARELTSDPVWGLLAMFPWGGQNLEAVETATASVDELADEGLPALVEAGQGLATFRGQLAAGNLDAASLQQVADQVAVLDASLESTRADIEAIDRSYLVRAVSRSLDDLAEGLDATEAVQRQLGEQAQQGAGG